MQINLPKETELQSLAAGYASVEMYVHRLVIQDRERLVIEQGIEAMKQGRVRHFDDFDHEFRLRHNVDD